jgi:hypothetical protein
VKIWYCANCEGLCAPRAPIVHPLKKKAPPRGIHARTLAGEHLMKKTTIAFVLFLALAAPAAAQDCPTKHPALTPLDHSSMIAAYTASYLGLYGHPPSMQAGSGADDGNYWVAVSDHFGEFSDGICRAGWNAYWETKVGTLAASVSPALGDQPARFQPSINPPPPPPPPPPIFVPPPPPPVLPALNLEGVYAQLALLNAKIDHVDQNVTEGRAENRSFFGLIKDHWKAIVGVIATAGGGFITGQKF